MNKCTCIFSSTVEIKEEHIIISQKLYNKMIDRISFLEKSIVDLRDKSVLGKKNQMIEYIESEIKYYERHIDDLLSNKAVVNNKNNVLRHCNIRLQYLKN